MRTSASTRLLLLLAAALLLFAACRRGEEAAVPTPAATAALPTEAPEESIAPTAAAPTEEPAPQPTAESGGLAPAGVNPEDIDWAPQVVSVSPASGEQSPVNAPIALQFDQPMDQSTVESAFSVEPNVPGDLSWTDAQTVVFTPSEPLGVGQSYLVRVANSASSLNGQTLQEPVAIDWQTVDPLRATQVGPADNALGVPLDAIITVAFNQPVVPLVSTGDQADLPQPLTIEPAVEGTGEWVSTSIYRFIPATSLAGGTRYTVSIDPGLQTFAGTALENPSSWQFTTLSPEVIAVVPANEAVGVSPSTTISVTFSAPMDRAATEAATSLSGPNGPVAVTFGWADNDTTLVVKPAEMMPVESQFTLTVSTAAVAAAGGSALDKESTTTFTTVPFPAVKAVTPPDGAVADQWQRGVNIEFVSPMDPETIEDRLIIEPAPEDAPNYYYNEWEGQSSVYVDFPLVPNTQYTVTIPGDAADPYGNMLGEDYTWTFAAPPYASVASFNLPRDVAQLSNVFPSTVEVIYRNVSDITVGLYEQPLDVNLLFNTYEISQTPPTGEPVREFTVSPTAATDEIGVSPVELADGGTLPNGLYRLRATAPELKEDDRFWQNQNVILVVGDTNLVVKEMFGKVHVWATDLATGQPAAGRNLTLYKRSGEASGTAVTDENGFASFDYEPSEPYLEGVVVVSNEPGQPGFGIASSFWNGGASPWTMGVQYDSGPEQPIFAYIYTDRPIYRPGDTVYYKGIVRSTNFGRYTLPDVETLEVSIAPQFFTGEENPEVKFTVELDENGHFNGEYVIPESATLGTYQFTLTGGNYYSSYRPFTVAEYRKPEFMVTMTAVPTETLRGETADVTLEASYLFGAPASNLAVNWTAYEKPFVPQIETQPPYAFGDTAQFFYEDTPPFGGGGAGGELGNYLIGGQGTTDDQGRLVINLPADLLDDAKPGGREVTVEATVIGPDEFPLSARTSVIFHAAETYVGLRTDDYVFNADQEATVDLITVDRDGNPIPNAAVEVVFYQRDWESERNADFGVYFTQWTPVDTEVARQSVTTDADGKASVSFTPDSGGSYLAVATVTDAAGREQVSSLGLWVLEEGFVGWRSDPNQRTMDIVRDKDEYRVGDTARLLVQSPFAQPVQAWLTIERGALIEQRVVTVEGGQTLEVPITADMAPNVHVTVHAIKPVNDDPDFPYADIRLGITELVVNPEQLTLGVTLTPAQESYAPGDTATYNIEVTDYQGNPASAEVSLALVDLAVLLLKEDNAPPIEEAFYARQPLRSQTGSGLFISGEGLEPEAPLAGGGFGGGGGGDVAMEAARLPEDEDVRGDFKDTAYWEATLQVDGSATVEIPLPDNLTTWRLSSKAVANDTVVGQGYTDVEVQLPLQVRPVTPRFFTVGDTLRLGANVDNNTDQPIDATVSLEATGLTIDGEAQQTVTIPAGGREFVSWNATVQDGQWADLTFRVEGGGYTDASKPTIGTTEDGLMPVFRFNGRDFVATAGELNQAGRRVEALVLPQGVDPSQGNVTVTMQPSLAAAMIESLEVVTDPADYEVDCAHVFADRIIMNTATQKAINDLSLDRQDLLDTIQGQTNSDVSRLQALARPDGGWGWCFSEETDPWLSAYSLLALTRAQAQGYDVNGDVIGRAADYLTGQLKEVGDLQDATEANRQAFFLYVLASAGQDIGASADALIAEHRALLDPYAKALLAMAYEMNGVAGDAQAAMLSDLNDTAILSATGAHWEDKTADFLNLSSDIRGTAMVIDALSQLQPDTNLLAPAVRWLMVARRAQTWPTTHETAWSISALSDYMAATGELNADYPYTLNVNLLERASGAFTSDNLLEGETVQVPVGELVQDGLNYFDFQREAGDGRLYYTMQLDSAIDVQAIDPVSRGMTVTRQYFDAACDPKTETCEPITQAAPGQRIRAQVTTVLPEDRVFVVLEDPIPAGTEAIDPNLLTSPSGTGGSIVPAEGQNDYGWWGWWYFDHIQYGDEKVTFLSQFLPAGTYQYSYYLDPVIPGTFQVMPATAREQFFPEVFGRSEGSLFTITQE